MAPIKRFLSNLDTSSRLTPPATATEPPSATGVESVGAAAQPWGPRTSNAYDVATISAAQLAALAPAMRKTITDAKKTYQRELAATPPARLLVMTSAGNGGAPVLAIIPPGFDASKPVTLQTHYHGDNTSVAAATGSHTASIKEHLTLDPQRVWVVPEARGNVGQSGTDWNNVSSQAQTARDAVEALGITHVERTVVSAHSAGGRALAYAMRNDEVRADQLRLLDCLYEPSSTTIRTAIANHPSAYPDVVILRTGSYPGERDDALVRAAGGRARIARFKPADGWSAHEATVRSSLVS